MPNHYREKYAPSTPRRLCATNGVFVAVEMKIDLFGGQNLRFAAAGGAAFDAKDGSEGRLAQGDDRFPAEPFDGLGEPMETTVLPSPVVGVIA
jgi:hypothetical protein